MRDDRERLQDLLEAIERILKYTAEGRIRFEESELIQNWVVHHLQIIGEAARGLSDDFRKRHEEIPWSKIIGMRHILVHDYFAIDAQIVWSTVEKDLPELQRKCRAIMGHLGSSD